MRKVVSGIHRYVGMALAFLLCIGGCTGALITFSTEMDSALNPALRKVEPRALTARIDDLAASARKAVPDHPIRLIAFHESPRDAAEIWYRGTRHRAYADPYSGQILGVRDTHDSLSGLLIDLHIHLLAEGTGKQVVGWAGAPAIVLILLGLWLWWPKPGRWGKALSIKWDAAAVRVWLDLHKLTGITASAFLIVTAATGSALALYDRVTEPLLIAVFGMAATTPAPQSLQGTGVPASLDTMTLQAKTIFPEGRLTRIVMPSNAQSAVAIRLRLPGEIHQLGRTFLYFDQYDGTLLRTDNALEANKATRLYNWLYPLHTGFYGGTATRLLNVLLGLSLALLAVSGCWIWVKNTIAKRRSERSKRASSPVAGAAK